MPAPRKGIALRDPITHWRLGRSTLATADKGRVVAEALVSHVVALPERFARLDFAPTPPLTRYLG